MAINKRTILWGVFILIAPLLALFLWRVIWSYFNVPHEFYLINEGNVIKIKTSIENNEFSVNAIDAESGYGALDWAVSKRRLDIVNLLLENGADVNAKSHGGDSPLQRALRYQEEEIVSSLIKHGADVNYQGGDIISPLARALVCGMPDDTINLFINNGVDLDRPYDLLHDLISWGNSECLNKIFYLLPSVENGINQIQDGKTLLDFANEGYNDYLINNQYENNSERNNSSSKYVDIITFLRAHGAMTAAELAAKMAEEGKAK